MTDVGTHCRDDLLMILDNDEFDHMTLKEKVERALKLAENCGTCRKHLEELMDEFQNNPKW
jgi:bacterioferritin-associated ferredoxin